MSKILEFRQESSGDASMQLVSLKFAQVSMSGQPALPPSDDIPVASKVRFMQLAKSSGAAQPSVIVKDRCRKNVTTTIMLRLIWAGLATLPFSLAGCSLFPGASFKMPAITALTAAPSVDAAAQQANYVPVGAGASLPSSTFTQEVYQSVRNAKANNSVVLQILDDDVPIRVLPLPTPDAASGDGSVPGGQSVFVSTLLQQTGVLKKLGKVQAALYRPSPDSFEGVRMDVLFVNRAPEQIRPESDYALRPGDRLVVAKDTRVGMESFIDMVLDR
ncbi:hypothetical protein [Aporhodopirellula aestuarii]|uniref:Soluble ligand binding domain-containing protein n=1 Tax=Aporhodopirellula aestuarii TaxID=2950107 RepID=A0ABT0U0Z1_9BACT|nr:hypothetical protein [Aporhodopirellula aestuarii]MCM2370518.1 hypothetical protein [Aporhodopirellula aestuarii]